MTRRASFVAAALVCIVVGIGFAQQPAAPTGAAAQGPGAPPAGGGRGGPQAPAPLLDIATARKAMAAAEAVAAAGNFTVTIAIVDANGDLVMLHRLDGARGVAVTSAEGKARAAILFGVPTSQIQDAMAANQAVTVRVTNPPLGGFEITPARGGLPIIKDGKVIGGIGAGGSAPANDEKVAQGGIDAIK
jgi:glc operon protein GlcG